MERWVQGSSWWITQLMSLRGSGHYEAVNFGLISYTTEKNIYLFGESIQCHPSKHAQD